MFLNKKYVLANEITQSMNIHSANISAIKKAADERGDFSTVIKMGNCLFLNSKSINLPNHIYNNIQIDQFTDISDKLPCTWVRQEYEVKEREMFKSGLVIDRVQIASKNFYVFSPEYAKLLKYKVPYILTEAEKNICTLNNQIEGAVKLGKNRYFTWY